MLGKEAIKLSKALHILDDQGGMLGRAGENLLQPFFLGTDHVQQKLASLRGDLVDDMIDVLPAVTFCIFQ